MESFLNGYLATVLLEGDKRDDKIGDLINCCYANSFNIDPRIEQALCLETLKTRVEEAKLDRETLALARRITPPDLYGNNWILHHGLRTQVYLLEPELSLNDAFSAEDPTDKEAGECWKTSLSVRRRYLSKILDKCENQRSEATIEKVEEEYPKDKIIHLFNKVLIEKSQTSKEELLEVQKEACSVMKQKRVSNDLLKIMSSPSVDDDQSLSYQRDESMSHQGDQSLSYQGDQSKDYQGQFISVEELARKVVYDGEEIQIPSILPPRFEKAAEKAKRRIQELREEKEAAEQIQFVDIGIEGPTSSLNEEFNETYPQFEVLEAQLDTIAEQLEALTPPHPQPPAGDPTNVQDSTETNQKQLDLSKQCEEMRKELESEKESEERDQMKTPGPRSDQQPLLKCLTGTPWKKKKQKRNSANSRYSIPPSVNGNHSHTPNRP